MIRESGKKSGPAPTEGRGELALVERPDGVRFSVHVRPRASRSMIGEVRAGVLEVKVAAPPEDGEANAELVKLLARVLGAGRASIVIVVGESRRTKVIEVRGMKATDARERLAKAAA